MMKVTVVVDNHVPLHAKRPFRAEHGLSLLIEVPEGLFLFDTGQSDVVIHNLSLLSVRPADLTGVIISHGHYDHTGGLTAILSHAKKSMPVYIHQAAFTARYSQSDEQCRFIGIPYSRELLTQLGADFHYVDAPLELTPNLWISGSIPRTPAYEQLDPHFVSRQADCCLTQDSLPDDMGVYYRSERGLVVLAGCSHSGLLNVIQHGFAVTGCTTLAGVLGGTHLGPAAPEFQQKTLQELAALTPAFVAANHCTGFSMLAALAQQFGDRFTPAFVGTALEC